MKIEKLEGIITVLSEAYQGGDEKTGASSLLNRQEIFIDGEKLEIPYISGNSIRGIMRRLIWEDLLDRLGIKLTQIDVFHAFFDGGALQSVGSSGMLDLDLRKRVIELLPPAHLWGFSLGNQIFSSNMQIKQVILCCKENLFRIPETYKKFCKYDHYSFIGQRFFTRKDESGLSGIKKEKDDPTIQMKVDMEVFIPGTKFYTGLNLINPSVVEISCIGHALNLWQNLGTIGGKASSGLGQIKIEIKNIPDPKKYLEFIEENKKAMVDLIENIQDEFRTKKNKSKIKKTTKKGKKNVSDQKGDSKED